MQHVEHARSLAVALMASAALVLATCGLTPHDSRVHPDRETTRVERVTDVQLPTLPLEPS